MFFLQISMDVIDISASEMQKYVESLSFRKCSELFSSHATINDLKWTIIPRARVGFEMTNKEARAVYYTVVRHDGDLIENTREI